MKWILFSPELYLLLMTAVFLGISMLAGPHPRRDFIAGLFMAAAGVLVTIGAVGFQGTLFTEAYRVDLFSQVFKLLLMIGLFFVISLCSSFPSLPLNQSSIWLNSFGRNLFEPMCRSVRKTA